MPHPDDTPSLHVIGRLDLPAFSPDDFPGFTMEQICAGLTVPAVKSEPTQWPVEAAARICPVFRSITGRAR